MAGTTTHPDDLSASGLTIAVIWARFNDHITSRLRDAAVATLKERDAGRIPEFDVPGAFELPWACQVMLVPPPDPAGELAAGIGRLGGHRPKETTIDAVVALGCVIRGDTPHFEYVSSEVARGLMDVQLRTRVPIAFGVLTCDDEAQALARSGDEGNKGAEAALTAIEMARFAREVADAWEK